MRIKLTENFKVKTISLIVGCTVGLIAASMLLRSPRWPRSIITDSQLAADTSTWNISHHKVYWLSDSTVFLTDNSGQSKIAKVPFGSVTNVSNIDEQTNGMVLWHSQIEISPDRKSFICVDDGKHDAAVYSVNGKLIARWAIQYNGVVAWSADSRHWIQYNYDESNGKYVGEQVYDVKNPKTISRIDLPIADAFVNNNMKFTNNGVSAVDIPNPLGENPVVKIYSGASATDNKVISSTFQVDGKPDIVEASFSPSGKYILWLVDLQVTMHTLQRSRPFVRTSTTSEYELLLTDSQGKELHNRWGFPATENQYAGPSDVEWLPNDAGFGFIYHNHLYVHRLN